RLPDRPQPTETRMSAPTRTSTTGRAASMEPTGPPLLRRSLRRLAGFAMTGALLGLLSLTPAMPVSALDQAANAIRVTENQTVEKDYGPIGSSQPLPVIPPSPVPKLNTPDNCRRATYCDTIPLEVVLGPTLKPLDEFFVTV